MNETEKWKRTATLNDALSMGLTEKEFLHVKEVLGHGINIVELGICAALYSEHCSYKSTKVHLKGLPVEGERVLQGPGENAGIVDIGDGKAVAFKVESHNHPSFIEPFQGAATGVGGILRDVFTMGARPIALMNSLRFGDPENSRTKYLLTRAVAGIGSYGNCVGVPTVGGELFFHEAYNGNCLVNAFALGVIDSDKIFLGKASGPGNPIFYVGSKTGRDGIHGATMASEAFDEDSDEKRPTVQVGDPFQEKLLIEACLEVMASGAVVGIQDMGAAGMTSSTYEMADRAGSGVRIHLDLVPQREQGMNPYEIMLSESQERMLLVVEKGREDEVIKIFTHWELDVVKIGEVIEGSNVELYWHKELVSSIPPSVLVSSVPQYRWPEAKPGDYEEKLLFPSQEIREPLDLSAAWHRLLGSENLCSRWQVYGQYDSTVRSNTVIHPGGDAAVVRIKNENGVTAVEKGIAMTLDCNSRYCALDPRQGAALSLAEACRNIAAVGATPIGISDCLNCGSPERPEGMWQIAECIRGIGEAARAYGVPVVSGNVSLYNETKGRAILPTPLLAVLGLLEDASKAVPAQFQKEGDLVYVLGETKATELGGSEYLSTVAGVERGALPVLDYDLEIETANLIRALINDRLLRSCHDISSGGLAVALAECCLSRYHSIGAAIEVEESQSKGAVARDDGLLFSESGARYIISFDAANQGEIRERITKWRGSRQVPIAFSGVVGGDSIAIRPFATIKVAEAHNTWLNGLSRFFGGVVENA